MKIHEHQAKELLARYGIPVPEGHVAFTPDEAQRHALALESSPVALKAQILAGGRKKGGGIKLVDDPDDVYETASGLIGMNLVTHQTGPDGQEVEKILVEEGVDIDQELYVGITLDRSLGRPVVMASTEGGVDIEEVADRSPEAILTAPLDPPHGIRAFRARDLARRLGYSGSTLRTLGSVIAKLARAYHESDASLAELNPLVITGSGEVVALDAKINLDDSALFRHEAFLDYRDPAQWDESERQAREHGLSYVSLDGNVGCMVNGAGLAMATMDAILLAGGEPANFLDVGGGASEEKVTAAFRIILRDPDVQAILVNIFGGIMHCDKIARGVLDAVREVDLGVPLVVRLEGTNVEEGRRILRESDLAIIRARGMSEAAEKVVGAAKGEITAEGGSA